MRFFKKGGKLQKIEDNPKQDIDGSVIMKNEDGKTIGKMDMHWKGDADKLREARKIDVTAEIEGETVFEDVIHKPSEPELTD